MQVRGSVIYERLHSTSVKRIIHPTHKRRYLTTCVSFAVSLLVGSTAIAGPTVQTCILPDAIVVIPNGEESIAVRDCLEQRLFAVIGTNATFVEANDSIEAKRMVETGQAQIALLNGEKGMSAQGLTGFNVNLIVSNVIATDNHGPMITAAARSLELAAPGHDQSGILQSHTMSKVNQTYTHDVNNWSVSAIGNHAFELAKASGLVGDNGEITSRESGDEKLVRYLRDWTPRAAELFSNQTSDAAQHFHLVGINCV